MAYEPAARHELSGRVAITWPQCPQGENTRPLIRDAETGALLDYDTLLPGRLDRDSTGFTVELWHEDGQHLWYTVVKQSIARERPTFRCDDCSMTYTWDAGLDRTPFEVPGVKGLWLNGARGHADGGMFIPDAAPCPRCRGLGDRVEA